MQFDVSAFVYLTIFSILITQPLQNGHSLIPDGRTHPEFKSW